SAGRQNPNPRPNHPNPSRAAKIDAKQIIEMDNGDGESRLCSLSLLRFNFRSGLGLLLCPSHSAGRRTDATGTVALPKSCSTPPPKLCLDSKSRRQNSAFCILHSAFNTGG